MKPPAVLRWLLWPASLLFQGVVRVRAWCYRYGIFKQRRLNGVVISVGNLTVGGTGKTPMVIWLTERLLAEGKRVAILTRGYRGSRGGFATPEAAKALPNESFDLSIASDEVSQYWRRFHNRVMLGAGADRVAWGRKFERAGAEWFLLDDGFQHLRLARDVEIVLIDASNPFGGGALLPSGLLREPPSALSRADIVVITRSERSPASEAVVRRFNQGPIFYAQTELNGVFQLKEKDLGAEKADWRRRKFFVFCAIGNPAAFLVDLRGWGIAVVGSVAYPDHHTYSQKDADDLEKRARAAGAEALLCTEKDLHHVFLVRFASFRVHYCRVDLKISDPDAFWQAVNERVSRRRAGTTR